MVLSGNNNMPYLKSLNTCLNRIVCKGYTEHFVITDNGLEALQHHKNYNPEQVKVINYFRFEGNSDNAVLLVIETIDGTKGTLVGAKDLHNNSAIDKLIKNTSLIKKNIIKN